MDYTGRARGRQAAGKVGGARLHRRRTVGRMTAGGATAGGLPAGGLVAGGPAGEDWPAGIVARPISNADVGAWARLLADVEAVEHADEHYDAEDLAEELADPRLDPAADTLGLWHGDQLVAYAVVRTPPSVVDIVRYGTEGAVHPEWRRRGLGLGLVRWKQRRVAEIHAERYAGQPARLGMGGKSDNEGLRALAERCGFQADRWFFSMERDLRPEPLPRVPAPADARIVLFEPEYDELTLQAHNEAFLDHWGFAPRDLEFWHTWVTQSRAFRPGLSSLLLDRSGKVVSYVLGYEFEADTEATGVRDCYIGQIGTLREWRGRGAARALITNTLNNARSAGFDTASLGVDADNPTGALGLYEGLGFTIVHRQTAYGYAF